MLRNGSFGRATVPDHFPSNNIKSKFFLESNGLNKSSEIDNISAISGFSDKIKIIESNNEETVLKQGILKMFLKESGKYKLIKLVFYINLKIELFELLSNLRLKSLQLGSDCSLIVEKFCFELFFKEENVKIYHEDEKEIRSWVELIRKVIPE